MIEKISTKDFEFFTFITGLENKEQILIKRLLETFPYKKTHKLNIIDKSLALKNLFKNNKKINYSERHYIKKKKLDFDFSLWQDFKKVFADNINIIIEHEFDFHMTSFHKIMTKYSKTKYSIILDSDIEFKNSTYLPDIVAMINKYNDSDDIAAVGEVYQEAPFSLPLNKLFSHDFYKLFLKDRSISFFAAFRGMIKYYLRGLKPSQKDRIHKLPRLFFALLTVNKELYCNENIFSKNLWIEIIDVTSKSHYSNRVMGDAGS